MLENKKSPELKPQTPRSLNREEWISRFWSIKITGIDIAAPVTNVNRLDAGWSIVRVGSVWHRDEEYHIYAIEDAVKGAVEYLRQDRRREMFVVSPIWVFSQVGNNMRLCRQRDIIGLAERNFMRLINDIVHKRRNHG